MKTTLTFVALAATTTTAFAHTGHLNAQAGHDHWLALGALGIAVTFAAWAGLSGKKVDTKEA